jgi:centrosomal protein CEP104
MSRKLKFKIISCSSE